MLTSAVLTSSPLRSLDVLAQHRLDLPPVARRPQDLHRDGAGRRPQHPFRLFAATLDLLPRPLRRIGKEGGEGFAFIVVPLATPKDAKVPKIPRIPFICAGFIFRVIFYLSFVGCIISVSYSDSSIGSSNSLNVGLVRSVRRSPTRILVGFIESRESSIQTSMPSDSTPS